MKPLEMEYLRRKRDISPKYMANKLNISESLYCKKERGDSPFKARELPIIVNELRMTFDQFNDALFDGELVFYENELPSG